MYRKVRSAIIRILFISGLSLIPLLVSCGKSIENAQDFVPNDPPVIEGCTVTDNATGKEVDASNIVLGMTLKCAVKAVDPEGKPLEYTFRSDYVSLSSQTSTADGCDGVFVVTRVVANTPVTLTVAVRDPKDASATKLIPIGTGKEGPLLTLGSPVKAGVNNAGSTTFSFNCTSDGWYQVLESADDVSKDPAAYMSTSTKYTAGAAKTATAGGPSYSGAIDSNTVKVSSGDAVKKIWIIFKDNNNYYTASSVSVSLDNMSPTIASTSPADGGDNVSTAPTISVVFGEAMDGSSFDSTQLTIAGGTVSYVDYNSTTHTARYNVTGLSKNTTYFATVANAKDVAGNTMTSGSFSFKTTPTYAVTYNGNGSDGGTLPASASYDSGQTVTVHGNTGPVTKTGFTFMKWNTEADGGGDSYTSGSTFEMSPSDVTLYAIWKQTNPSTVTLNMSRICLDANGTSQLTKTLSPAGTINTDVSWNSSNTSVATVTSGGYVTAVSAGSSVITCTASGGASSTCLVTVIAPVTVSTFATGFNCPADITSDGINLYVADHDSCSIKKVVISTKAVSTLIGGSTGSNVSGTDFIFKGLRGITCDGSYLYAADNANARVMKIPLGGGSSSVLVSGSILKNPQQIVYDSSTSLLYVADYGGSFGAADSLDIKGITPGSGFIAEAPGSNSKYFNGVASFNLKLYGCTARSIHQSNGSVFSIVAGSESSSGASDGNGSVARFSNLSNLAHDDAGNLYVSDTGNHNIRKITPSNEVTTIAGNGTAALVNGTGPASSFNYPMGMYVVSKTTGDKSAAKIYVADWLNNVIRVIEFP